MIKWKGMATHPLPPYRNSSQSESFNAASYLRIEFKW